MIKKLKPKTANNKLRTLRPSFSSKTLLLKNVAIDKINIILGKLPSIMTIPIFDTIPCSFGRNTGWLIIVLKINNPKRPRTTALRKRLFSVIYNSKKNIINNNNVEIFVSLLFYIPFLGLLILYYNQRYTAYNISNVCLTFDEIALSLLVQICRNT
jgi:hypothetical protein